MRVREVSRGPLFADDGPRGPRILRRVRGIALELVLFVVVTVLSPVRIETLGLSPAVVAAIGVNGPEA